MASVLENVPGLSVKHCIYGPDLFQFDSRVESKSWFDLHLEESWNDRVKKGYFRYELGDLQTKYLPGNYHFVVQLNIKRAIERRKPQDIYGIDMPFNPEKFHFGKVPAREIMMFMQSQHWGEVKSGTNGKYKHALIINVSPLEFCHSLLVPYIKKYLPQVLNFDALRVAVEFMLISSNSQLRMGYNSLGAFASVNHLHFHMYYLKHYLFLENAPVTRLEGACYELRSFPAEGFVFEISDEDFLDVLRCVMILIEYLIDRDIAHNVFLTRGTSFENPSQKLPLRIYVWAREAYYGIKDDSGFNLAVCELAGHLPIKDEKTYAEITESAVAESMQECCHDVFLQLEKK